MGLVVGSSCRGSWVFKLNCCLTWSYEALAVCHSPKLKVSISRLSSHLGCARELEISMESRSFRRGRVTALACMCRITSSAELLQVLLCWRPENLEFLLRIRKVPRSLELVMLWSWRETAPFSRTCCSVTLVTLWLLKSWKQGNKLHSSYISILSCTVLTSCSWGVKLSRSKLGISLTSGLAGVVWLFSGSNIAVFSLSTFPIYLYSWFVQGTGWRTGCSRSSWSKDVWFAFYFFLFSFALRKQANVVWIKEKKKSAM